LMKGLGSGVADLLNVIKGSGSGSVDPILPADTEIGSFYLVWFRSRFSRSSPMNRKYFLLNTNRFNKWFRRDFSSGEDLLLSTGSGTGSGDLLLLTGSGPGSGDLLLIGSGTGSGDLLLLTDPGTGSGDLLLFTGSGTGSGDLLLLTGSGTGSGDLF